PGRETLERHQDEILSLSRLEFTAGKDQEAVTEQAAPRRFMKQCRIDPLQDERSVINAAAAQDVRVPSRAGDDQLEFCRLCARLGVEVGVLEEYCGEVRIRFDPLAAGTGSA